MFSILSRIFIKDYKNTSDATVRRAYGELASILGIVLNIFLFIGKYMAGFISGSIAIMADAFNNLTDAGSSIITLIGFKYAGKKADEEHPFGHGRIEYVAGFIVSMAIIMVGIELLKSSIDKILHPSVVEASMASFLVLIMAIAVKMYMSFYNTKVGEKINSPTMKATALDSFTDTIATFVVMVSMLISKYAHINIDGYCGVLVALFIMYAGYGAAKDTMTPLIGKSPSKEFVKEIESIVMAHEEILGMHDLVVHDYGPGRILISLHGEVSGEEDVYVTHDAIDRIEHELNTKLGCEAVIHMDPIAVNDEFVKELREELETGIKNYSEKITMHDLRVVKGNTHNNIIFDIVVPYDVKDSDVEVKKNIESIVMSLGDNYVPVITVDKSYV